MKHLSLLLFSLSIRAAIGASSRQPVRELQLRPGLAGIHSTESRMLTNSLCSKPPLDNPVHP